MLPLVVCGAAGRMGRTLLSLIARDTAVRVHAAVESPGHPAVGSDCGTLAGVGSLGVLVVDDYASVADPETVTLDFTTAPATVEHMRVAVRHGAAMVIGTTGFNHAEQSELDRLALRTRCVIAPNMSVGVNVLLKLAAIAAGALGTDFDPEIVEMHHRLKVDAPSGTALALGQAVATALGRDFQADARFDRHGVIGQRAPAEIGIMALRGGDTVGDHTVFFAGMGERIELTHRAQSRECLARGAIRAAVWLASQPGGRYGMTDVLGL